MTIYDIAKLAGVSASSVSRVVNGKPGVNRETRAKVQKLLQEYHYVPDANARNLVTQSTRTIGILTDDIDAMHQVEGSLRLEKELMLHGYYCFIKYIGSGSTAIREGMMDLAQHRVEGAICMGSSFRDVARVTAAVERHLPDTPVVMVNDTDLFPLENIYTVGADEEVGFSDCVDFMAKKKRRNLALLIDRNRISAGVIRSGFELGLRNHPEITGTIFSDIEPSVDGGEAIGRLLLKSCPKMDGVICSDDLIAIGVMNVLQDNGIRIPKQVSVLGEKNSCYCVACRPQLSSMDTMITTAAVTGARTLLDILNGRVASRRITLQMEIVERSST